MAFDDIPVGVLNRGQLRSLCDLDVISGADTEGLEPDTSSIDLRLSEEAWVLSATVKQRQMGHEDGDVRELLKKFSATPLRTASQTRLERGKVYLFRLKERLDLRAYPWLYGVATGKSSVGRIDVLTRLVVDRHPKYEEVPPGYSGELFVEVIPLSFPILVTEGQPLNQLRLFCGSPDSCRLRPTTGRRLLLNGGLKGAFDFSGQEAGVLRLDVTPDACGFVAFCAKPNDDPVICARTANDPASYFEGCPADDDSLVLQPDRFYILRSRERLSLAKDVAVTGFAYTEALGELRIHYAGFAHPYFGRLRKDRPGTPLIFEIRAHSFPVRVRDGEEIAKVEFFKMSEEAERPLDLKEEDRKTSYAEQELMLSGFFKPWPR